MSYCVDEGQNLFSVLEQQIIIDLGGQAQQVTQGEVLVNGALNGTELVKNQLIRDIAGACKTNVCRQEQPTVAQGEQSSKTKPHSEVTICERYGGMTCRL